MQKLLAVGFAFQINVGHNAYVIGFGQLGAFLIGSIREPFGAAIKKIKFIGEVKNGAELIVSFGISALAYNGVNILQAAAQNTDPSVGCFLHTNNRGAVFENGFDDAVDAFFFFACHQVEAHNGNIVTSLTFAAFDDNIIALTT